MRFSTRRWRDLKKSGFTLWEVLIIIVVISVGLLSVIVVLTDGMKYIQKTRQKIIAINLAREGMEAVYQMRDTNRTRRAWVKDTCRLKNNPLIDEWSLGCADDLRFTSGAYVLQRLTTWGQEYFALTWPLATWLNLDDGADTGDWQFTLCQQSWFWNACIGTQPSTSEGNYFREIEWQWLYLKNTSTTGWQEITCTWWLTSNCWTPAAKEFRFCSTVAYIGESVGEVRLCGVVTNFKGGK